MNRRPAALAVLALALSGQVTPAEAKPAPKPVCLLVTDAQGDGAALGQVPAASLDIVSADIATGAKNLAAAIRMKTLQKDAFLAGGTRYSFSWSVGGIAERLTYEVTATGDASGRFDANIGDGGANDAIVIPAVADATTSTITWTVNRQSVPPLKKGGAKFTGLKLETFVGTNAGSNRGTVGSAADSATTGKSYVDRTPTCLKGV